MPDKHQCRAPYSASRPYESLTWTEKLSSNISEWTSSMLETLGHGPSADLDDSYDPAGFEIRRIRVYIHVIWNNETEKACGSSTRIHHQIAVLNEAFRGQLPTPAAAAWTTAPTDVRAEFIWNTSVNLKKTDQLIVGVADIAKTAPPVADHLNVWVCNFQKDWGCANDPEDKYPYFDGVVVDYMAFGLGPPCDPDHAGGRTLPHEVGHWLGLFHTNEAAGLLGDVTKAMPGDFMDTANDDPSMVFFTKRQAMRMRRWLETGKTIRAAWK